MEYAWAQNRSKLERAKGELYGKWDKISPEPTEEDIKARYVELAGKVLNDDGTQQSDKPARLETVVEEKPKAKKK